MIQLHLLPLFLILLLCDGCTNEPPNADPFEFLQHRLETISLLANRFTKMHLDDAVHSGYEKTLEILDSVDSTSGGPEEAHSFALAQVYYAGANVFLTAAYLPAMTKGTKIPPEEWVIIDTRNPPPYLELSDQVDGELSLPFPLVEKAQREYELRKLFEQAERSQKTEAADAPLWTARLHHSFVDALLFYLGLTGLAGEELREEFDTLRRQGLAEKILTDSSLSPYARSLKTSAIADKYLFMALTDLYACFCVQADRRPDMAAVIKLAEQMDSLFIPTAATEKELIEAASEDMARSAQIIEELTEMVVETIDANHQKEK